MVAHALLVMMNVLDVAHLVMIRRGNGGERCEHRGAGNEGQQAGSRLDNGVHRSTLA
ncbi:hypothetical protein PUN4_840020 [Paraburkholderia unamae]|nr:hypothetical protein PUN4_840020 [Paraburkholderia unamae]